MLLVLHNNEWISNEPRIIAVYLYAVKFSIYALLFTFWHM